METTNIKEIRSLFPHLKTGRIYFNHAAIGAISTKVRNAVDEYLYQRSVTRIENYFDFVPKLTSAKERLGRLLNAPTDRICWMENVTNGINLLAQSLDWQPGDRILLNDYEFPANVYPFLNLQSKGVIIDIPNSHGGRFDFEDVVKNVTPRTKLVSISNVQFLSGYRADIDKIGEFCREKGIIFCVDAIQGAGVVKIDVEKSKIDFLAGGSQKWLMAMEGSAYVYIRKELEQQMQPAHVGWTGVNNAWDLLDFKLDLRDDAAKFQCGTVNMLGIAALEASLEMFESVGYNKIEEIIVSNTNYFMLKLIEIGIEPLLKDLDYKNLAGIVSFKHEKAEEIFAKLNEKKINGAIREGIIRFSPHFYNSVGEIDEVIDVLKKLL